MLRSASVRKLAFKETVQKAAHQSSVSFSTSACLLKSKKKKSNGAMGLVKTENDSCDFSDVGEKSIEKNVVVRPYRSEAYRNYSAHIVEGPPLETHFRSLSVFDARGQEELLMKTHWLRKLHKDIPKLSNLNLLNTVFSDPVTSNRPFKNLQMYGRGCIEVASSQALCGERPFLNSAGFFKNFMVRNSLICEWANHFKLWDLTCLSSGTNLPGHPHQKASVFLAYLGAMLVDSGMNYNLVISFIVKLLKDPVVSSSLVKTWSCVANSKDGASPKQTFTAEDCAIYPLLCHSSHEDDGVWRRHVYNQYNYVYTKFGQHPPGEMQSFVVKYFDTCPKALKVHMALVEELVKIPFIGELQFFEGADSLNPKFAELMKRGRLDGFKDSDLLTKNELVKLIMDYIVYSPDLLFKFLCYPSIDMQFSVSAKEGKAGKLVYVTTCYIDSTAFYVASDPKKDVSIKKASSGIFLNKKAEVIKLANENNLRKLEIVKQKVEPIQHGSDPVMKQIKS